MAHIEIRGQYGEPQQIVINGIDFSSEIYRGVELVSVGKADSPFAEVGLRLIFAVGRLDIDTEVDVPITDHLPAVAQRVASIFEEPRMLATPLSETTLDEMTERLAELRRAVDDVALAIKGGFKSLDHGAKHSQRKAGKK